MAMRCTVCDHRESIEINRLLAENVQPKRRIAENYKLSEASLIRHADRHLSKILERAAARAIAKDEDQFLDSIQFLMTESAQYVTDAHAAVKVQCVGKNEYREYRDVGAMAAAINSARAVTELLGNATGRLNQAAASTVNIALQLVIPRDLSAQGPTELPVVDTTAEVSPSTSDNQAQHTDSEDKNL